MFNFYFILCADCGLSMHCRYSVMAKGSYQTDKLEGGGSKYWHVAASSTQQAPLNATAAGHEQLIYA